MNKICNLIITGSMFILLTSCAENQSFAELNRNILDTSASLLQTSQGVTDTIEQSTATSNKASSNKKSSNSKSSKISTGNNSLKEQLMIECLGPGPSDFRLGMQTAEQIEADKARERAYREKKCTCEVEYDYVAAQKIIALGFDGTKKTADKLSQKPGMQQKVQGIIQKRDNDKYQNCHR